jgi:alpha-L-fucosidase
MTINNHWGYTASDENQNSTRTLLNKLARSAALGGNYLLNDGPTTQGEIQPVNVHRLREIGQCRHHLSRYHACFRAACGVGHAKTFRSQRPSVGESAAGGTV